MSRGMATKLGCLVVMIAFAFGCAATTKSRDFSSYCEGKDGDRQHEKKCLSVLADICRKTNGQIEEVCGSSGMTHVCDPYLVYCTCGEKEWDFEEGCR